jgi:hypothetical protein
MTVYFKKIMETEKIIENNGPKYSEMLMQLVEEFDEKLPIELTFEETIEVGIDAWNLANRKEFLLGKNLYEQELKSFKISDLVEKMVDFKLNNFSEFDNIIIDYSTDNNILKIKTQTQDNNFESLIRQIINVKPSRKEK